MQWKSNAIATAVLALALGAAAPAALAQNNCQFGERLDGSTAADAKKRIESSGFTQVRIGKKGCDNVWHATAVMNGDSLNLALTPDGQIFRETD